MTRGGIQATTFQSFLAGWNAEHERRGARQQIAGYGTWRWSLDCDKQEHVAELDSALGL